MAGRTAARLVGPLVLLLTVAPALWLVLRTAQGDLGADPVEELEHQTGIWALRFLALTLLVTPLSRLAGWSWLVKRRRALGVATFAYATLHLLTYVVIDHGLLLAAIADDIVEHPWVTLGMATWLMLLPLALTSTKGWIRRLGGRRWNRLHQLVYVCAVTGVLHYTLAVKKDVRLPLIYGAIFALLLAYRVVVRVGLRRARAERAAARDAAAA
ncbi:MAG TPA: protein-methionine-sulfoxide reductase heme-binding subunit MsrQ [Gemmatimonadaceae bacterium]|nr:protein-methionine-sulfoxide reductase heme-binding subunit MsrQ [Gemmatimonadaceae bacterium]